MRERLSRLLGATLIGAIVVSLGGCAWAERAANEPALTSATTPIYATDEIAASVDAVPQRTVKPLPASRLASGLIPPTNRWFSGLVFGEPSMPVFPLPLSFQLTDDGMDFGLPTISTSPAAIMGGFSAAVSVDVGAQEHEVIAYDTATVTVAQLSGGAEIGRTVIARGSPFVTFSASRDTTVRFGSAFSPVEDSVAFATVDSVEYGLVSDAPLATDSGSVTLSGGESATWFAVPQGGNRDELATAAGNRLTGTSVSYALADGTASTALTYNLEAAGPTLVAVMPHQSSTDADCTHGTYESIYGELQLCRAETLSWTVPRLEPSGTLALDSLESEDRERLLRQLEADALSTPAFPADTYFGGKALYRSANLLSIARELGADDVAASLEDRLIREINSWMEPDGCETRDARCFVYDRDARGLVGLQPSFGSDEFNDHHFHYGYLLYAAAVVAAGRDEVTEKWAPVMNLVAADLATSGSSEYFPERRVFDAYAGHSWASGTAPFRDGNNQESSSEAVTAWNGLALWAEVSDQPALLTEATWMLSAEAASAREYWTDFPLDSPVYSGFDHTVTSLVWGGKRDYATWFSAEPSAMLGILVLPMSPVSGYLAGDSDRIQANVAEAAPAGFDVLFGDYLLMYSALAGADAAAAARDAVPALPESRIDDGNSRTYLLAWILSR
ncbi:glycosyl hydrolase [Mycetocola zhujimingii]|uniref:glycosyl hydrolase n=1 Tax=Mycetocola zhujimingii TaxID=2079792 RepID=UPI000D3977B5|nr:glycosyl hydrolase [Mycetocola zhujimingii]AWB87025.1 1,3-beta-glucanase [Mycetocola zhujimingii]